MKRIPVQKIIQKDQEFYFFTEDPRKIIKEVDYPTKETVQDFQRPWKESRVKDLAKYVAGDDTLSKVKGETSKAIGLIPTCAILNVKNNIRIKYENQQYFLVFPETDQECINCKGDIEVIDGQHRLIAFDDAYRSPKFKDTEIYQMGFIVFDQLTENLKKEVFIVTNDRVEKVDKTVLQNMMMALGVLSPEDAEIFKLIDMLNKEDKSPLKGRINIDGGKLTNGIKMLQLQAVLKKSGFLAKLTSASTIQKKFEIFSVYLSAWENVYDLDFNKTKKITTLEKISGLRYIFTFFPVITEIIKSKHTKFNLEVLVDIINKLQEHNILPLTYSNNEAISLAFRGDTATVKMANLHAEKLKQICLEEEEEDIFAD